jgi:DNA-binding NtrC family response regulator
LVVNVRGKKIRKAATRSKIPLLQQIIDELLAHGISLDLAKKEFEKKYIVGAVKRSSGNLGRAASSLGIHRNTLRNKVGILNIRLPRERSGVSPDIAKKK